MSSQIRMKLIFFFKNVVFVSLVTSTSDLYSKFSRQDDLVFNLLNKPVKSGGEKLVKLIKKLNRYLELVIKLMYKNKVEVKNVTTLLLEQGGPKYMDTAIKEDELKSSFNWTDEQLVKLYEERKKTLELFYFIKLAYKKFFSCLL